VFSGTGVHFDGNKYLLKTDDVGGGNTTTIFYKVTDPVSGCFKSTSKDFDIYSQPVINEFELRELFNVGEGKYVMNTDPANGLFAINDISQGLNNEFNPSQKGVGAYRVKYTYEDENFCSSELEKTTTVDTVQGSFTGLASVVCYDAGAQTLLGANPYGDTGVFTGNGIFDNGDNSASFDPVAAHDGSHTIVYTYWGPDHIAKFEVVKTVEVDSVGNLQFIDLDSAYCEGTGTVNFKAAPEQSLIMFSEHFSGVGVEDVVANDGKARFVTADVSPNDSSLISYTFVDVNGCSADVSQWVTVDSLPVIRSVNVKPQFNSETEEFRFEAVPSGGVFSSNNISLLGDDFYPVKESQGEHSVMYTFTDGNECVSSLSTDFKISPADATIESILINSKYCIDADPDTIVARPGNGGGSGRFVEYVGLRNVGGNKAVIYPDSLGAGGFSAVYNYTTLDGLTEYSVSQSFSVQHLASSCEFMYWLI